MHTFFHPWFTTSSLYLLHSTLCLGNFMPISKQGIQACTLPKSVFQFFKLSLNIQDSFQILYCISFIITVLLDFAVYFLSSSPNLLSTLLHPALCHGKLYRLHIPESFDLWLSVGFDYWESGDWKLAGSGGEMLRYYFLDFFSFRPVWQVLPFSTQGTQLLFTAPSGTSSLWTWLPSGSKNT